METLSRQALLPLLPIMLGAASPPEAAGSATGLWRNPHGTVVVRTSNCGANLCGAVVWASPEAISDAREAGVENLIGTQLLRDYRPNGPGRWRGTVFVPDMGKSFYSTIVQRGKDRMLISGCILGGLICKRQEWSRQ